MYNDENQNTQQINQAGMQPEVYQQPISFTGEAVQKKSPVLWIVLAGLVVLLAAGIVTIFLLLNGNSYEKSERGYFGNLISAFDAGEDAAKGTHADIDIDIDEAALEQLLGTSFDVDTIGYSCDFANNGDDYMFQMALKYGSKQLFGANLWTNSNNEYYIVQFPAEISQYLIDYRFEQNNDNNNVTIDREVLMNFIGDAANEYFAIVGKPEVEPNVQVYAGKTALTADKTVILFTNSMLNDFIKRMEKLVLEKEEYLDLITSFSGEDKETARTRIQEEIDKAPDYGEEGADHVQFTMNVYSNGNGILGREIFSDDFTLKLFNVSNATSYADYFSITTNGEDVSETGSSDIDIISDFDVSYDSTGTIAADGSKTGTAEITVKTGPMNVYTVTINSSNVICTEEKMSGNISISIPAITLDMTVALSSAGEEKTMAFDVVLSGTKLGTITVSLSPSTLTYSAAPVVNEQNGVIYSNGEATGMSEELSNEIQSYITSLLSEEPFASLTGLSGMGSVDPDINVDPDPPVVEETEELKPSDIYINFNDTQSTIAFTELTGSDFADAFPSVIDTMVDKDSQSIVMSSSMSDIIYVENRTENDAVSAAECRVIGFMNSDSENFGINNFKIGVSTSEEITDYFGTPYSITTDENDNPCCYYYFENDAGSIYFIFENGYLKQFMVYVSSYDDFDEPGTSISDSESVPFVDANGRSLGTYPLWGGSLPESLIFYPTDEILESGDMTSFSNDEWTLTISLYNDYDYDVAYKDCYIYSITISDSRDIGIAGVYCGSTEEEVIEALGTPDDEYESMLTYEYGDYCDVVFYLGSDGKVDTISYYDMGIAFFS